MEDGTLIADAGELAVPLLSFEQEDDPATWTGFLATEALIVNFGQGAVAYTFERVK
ncbi:MAG: hypothetical protein R3C14_26540 [Caldilineaceae bacterium]